VTKYFDKEFDKFLGKLKDKENFAFARFSDGELFILRNETVILAENHFVTGNRKGHGIYPPEEQKEFIPEKHEFYQQKLVECFKSKMPEYYKGICCRNDVGEDAFFWQKGLHGGDEGLTFSNLLINRNYRRFVDEMVPVLKEREILYVVNESANLDGLPIEIKKDFRIGTNCMINNYGTIEEVKKYIQENDIRDHVVLCSAASLSNFIVHDCYADNPNNTFLDIGSCLNPYLEIEGWKHTRGYLTHYWLKSGSPYGEQVDIW
jgi:hypothetical protein